MPALETGAPAVKRLLKALHTLGAMGVTGAVLPAGAAPASPAGLGPRRIRALQPSLSGNQWLGAVPSLGVVVLSGFLSVGINRAFHSAPWVFIKLMFSVPVFESPSVVHGPLTADATRATAALAGDAVASQAWGRQPPARPPLHSPPWPWAHTALGIWRPYFRRLTHPKILRETPASSS